MLAIPAMGAETLSKLDVRPIFRPHSSLLAPPGAGKSMLARQLTTVLPAIRCAEALDTTHIHSVALLTGVPTAMVTTRPFAPRPTRSPMYA
jgi:predicted ATPase with chaperone activity